VSVNRRNLLQLGAASAAISLARIRPSNAQAADTIRIALAAGKPRSTDPNEVFGPDFWAVEQTYEQLVRSEDGNFALKPEDFKPTLATGWTKSDDARTWTFKLREGVKFHKGYGEMTSEDVVYSFERAKAKGTNKTVMANVDKVTANGPLEVTITLKTPDANLLGTTVSTANVSVVSKKAAEQMGAAFGTDMVGTGPYELAKFDSEKGTTLKRHEGYWGNKAKIANIECLYIADTTARTLALLSGDVDIIEAVRAPGWVDSMLQRDPTLKMDMTVPGSFVTLSINLTREPWNNLKVRQALMHAIDRDAISQALAPMGRPLVGLMPDFFPAGIKAEDVPADLQYTYDPAKAKALLAEAGFPNGLAFQSLCSQREDYSSFMLIMQEQMRPAGFNLDVKIQDHTTFHADNRSDKNTLVLTSSSYPPIPTQLYFQQLASASEVKSDGSGGLNFSHYGVKMPGIDALLEEAQVTPDFDRYVTKCKEIELQVLRDLPLIGLSTVAFTMVRRANLDLGYEVKSGYARWRMHQATKSV